MPETRVVLERCGLVDPDRIDSYLEHGGFAALKKAKRSMKPKEVIAAVKRSGLAGRGGAGFNCGMKWELAAGTRSKQKYLICNADEGEVGAFKDRYILSNDPFGLIEGMAIAALAIGARRAYVYLRAEYRFLRGRLESALSRSRERGFLEHVEIEIFEGAGAYVCGEESALMNSIEGFRGESRYKPPYPPVSGLWGAPTVINNVETLMNVPAIVARGHEWFAAMGTSRSRGTKVFSVSGDVERPGVYELEMGTPLVELAVGLAGAREPMAAQIGGAGGSILPGYLFDTPLAYETVLGSGAVVVLGRDRDIIDMVRNTIGFLHDESCGKCTPCRDGTEAMLEIYDRLSRGEGSDNDLNALEDLARVMSQASLCGLGQSAGVPVMDSIRYFRPLYADRIRQSAFIREYLGEKL